MTNTLPKVKIKRRGRFRIPFGITVTVLGFIIFLVGAEPSLFGLDRSPVIGFVQITVFLIGLGLICLGGYISLAALWNGGPKSIVSDIGQRLVGLPGPRGWLLLLIAFLELAAAGPLSIAREKPSVTPSIPSNGSTARGSLISPRTSAAAPRIIGS